MDAQEALGHITRALLSLLALISFVELARRGGRTRLDITLMLTSLGLPFLLPLLPNDIRQAWWVRTPAVMGIIAQPYLLLRLVEDFRDVPRSIMLAGLAGMVVSWGVYIAFASPTLPVAATLGIVGYFLCFEAYATAALAVGARNSGGVSRWRYALAASGSAWLAIAILLTGVAAAAPGFSGAFTAARPIFLLLAASAYFLGFASPGWLRRAWQMPEVRKFLRVVAGQPPHERTTRLLDEVCATASNTTGGLATVVFLWNAERKQFKAASSDVASLRDFSFPPDAGPLTRAWNERRTLAVRNIAGSGLASSRLASSVGASALLASPVATPNRVWGLLVVLQRRGSLFPSDDLALLEILSEQCAIAQENAELVAEQQRLAEQERRLVTLLQTANKELEAFSYSVSHDLRAPLRGIDGFSQALLEDYQEKLDAQGVHYLNRLRAASQLMGRLIDDLLKLSQLSRAQLRKEQVDLTALGCGIAARLQAQDPARKARFIIQDQLSSWGDPGLLQIALENLLGNAWKFTAKHPSATIEFGVNGNGQTPTFFVRDDGAGFDMAHADKLFNPFQRLHSQKGFEGTGIGLATVKRIINRHDGEVWAEGAVEKGATFYFTLGRQAESEQHNDSSGGRQS